MRRVVGAEVRIAHQIANGLHHIALGVDAKLAGSNLVAPLDVAFAVKQHHPVGCGLQGRQNLLQAAVAVLLLGLALAQQAASAVCRLAPHAAHGGRRGQVARTQPPQHPGAARQVPHKPGPCGHGSPQGRTPRPRAPPAQSTTCQLPSQKKYETPEHVGRTAFSKIRTASRGALPRSTTQARKHHRAERPCPWQAIRPAVVMSTPTKAAGPAQARNNAWGWAVRR